MPAFQFFSERLLAGEIASRITSARKPYGRTITLKAFGRRFIFDVVRSAGV